MLCHNVSKTGVEVDRTKAEVIKKPRRLTLVKMMQVFWVMLVLQDIQLGFIYDCKTHVQSPKEGDEICI